MSGGEWFHCGINPPVSRGAGRSAVAAIAYRTGTRIECERDGIIHDYSRKRGVVTSFTLAPEGAPDWATDAAQLWNEVEHRENRVNSQLAYDWDLALPASLDARAREQIARDFAQEFVDRYGVAVTVAIHLPGKDGDDKNHHAHIDTTTRAIDPEAEDGWGEKVREFSKRPGTPCPDVQEMREYAAHLINQALSEGGSDETVDPRSFRERGIVGREPTKHLGPAATAIERRARLAGDLEASDRGDINREIIEARLIAQEADSAEITAELERDLARRFGDAEPEPPDERTQAPGNTAGRSPEDEAERLAQRIRSGELVPDDAAAHGSDGMQPLDAAGGGAILPEPSRWRERMQHVAARAVEMWHDESSGGEKGSGWRWLHMAKDAVAAWWSRGENIKAMHDLADDIAQTATKAVLEMRADEGGGGELPDGKEPVDYSWTLRHEQKRQPEPGGDEARRFGNAEPEQPGGIPQEGTRPAEPLAPHWTDAEPLPEADLPSADPPDHSRGDLPSADPTREPDMDIG